MDLIFYSLVAKYLSVGASELGTSGTVDVPYSSLIVQCIGSPVAALDLGFELKAVVILDGCQIGLVLIEES